MTTIASQSPSYSSQVPIQRIKQTTKDICTRLRIGLEKISSLPLDSKTYTYIKNASFTMAFVFGLSPAAYGQLGAVEGAHGLISAGISENSHFVTGAELRAPWFQFGGAIEFQRLVDTINNQTATGLGNANLYIGLLPVYDAMIGDLEIFSGLSLQASIPCGAYTGIIPNATREIRRQGRASFGATYGRFGAEFRATLCKSDIPGALETGVGVVVTYRTND